MAYSSRLFMWRIPPRAHPMCFRYPHCHETCFKEGVVLSRESRSSEKFMHGIKVVQQRLCQ